MSLGVVALANIFEEDEEKTELQKAAEAARASFHKAAMDSVRLIQERSRRQNLERYGCDCPAARCYPTCPRIISKSEPAEFWSWWGKTSPVDPQNRTREVLPPGVPSFKSSSRSKRKRKKKPTFKNLYMET